MNKSLENQEIESILNVLSNRFHANMHRHPNSQWAPIKQHLVMNLQQLWSVNEMEKSGGEPDVFVSIDDLNHVYICDFSKESPAQRRSFCYDNQALEARKANKPLSSVMAEVERMGIDLMEEALYKQIQTIEPLDLKTSSWIKTPEHIRSLGGALFCDRRYDTVFVYHNGADSYYAARGFRGFVKLF